MATKDNTFKVSQKNGILSIYAEGDKDFVLDLTIAADKVGTIHLDGKKVNISVMIPDRFHQIYMETEKEASALKKAIDDAYTAAYGILITARFSAPTSSPSPVASAT